MDRIFDRSIIGVRDPDIDKIILINTLDRSAGIFLADLADLQIGSGELGPCESLLILL